MESEGVLVPQDRHPYQRATGVRGTRTQDECEHEGREQDVLPQPRSSKDDEGTPELGEGFGAAPPSAPEGTCPANSLAMDFLPAPDHQTIMMGCFSCPFLLCFFNF